MIDLYAHTDFWARAIEKEMKTVFPSFELDDDDTTILPGYKHIVCHMISDVKAHDLMRKARYVAGSHMTEPPRSLFTPIS